MYPPTTSILTLPTLIWSIPVGQFPLCQLLTLSIPIMSISHYINVDLVAVELVRIDPTVLFVFL